MSVRARPSSVKAAASVSSSSSPPPSASQPLSRVLRDLLRRLRRKDAQKYFHYPVSAVEVPVYYEHIRHPMDLSAMEAKLQSGQYVTVEGFIGDALLICRNALYFNSDESDYYKKAQQLMHFVHKLAAEAKQTVDYSLTQPAYDLGTDGATSDEEEAVGGSKGKRGAPTVKELLATAPSASSSSSSVRNRITIKLQEGSQSTGSSPASSSSTSAVASSLLVQRSKYRLLSFPRRVGIRPLGVDNNFLMSAHPTLMDLHTLHQRDQAILRHTQLHASERKGLDELDRLLPVLQYNEYRPSIHLPFDERYDDRLRKFASFDPLTDYPIAHFLTQHKLDAIAPPDSTQLPQRSPDDWTMDVRLLDGLEASRGRWRQQEPFMTAHEQLVDIKQMLDEARGRLTTVRHHEHKQQQQVEDRDEPTADADAVQQHNGEAAATLASEQSAVTLETQQLTSILVQVRLQVDSDGRVSVLQSVVARPSSSVSRPSLPSSPMSVSSSLAVLDGGSSVLEVMLTFQSRKRQYMLRQQQVQLRQQQQQQQQQQQAAIASAAVAAAHNSSTAYSVSSSQTQQPFAQHTASGGHPFIVQHMPTQHQQQQQVMFAQPASAPLPSLHQPAAHPPSEGDVTQATEATVKGKEKRKESAREEKRRRKERKEAERQRKRKERDGEEGKDGWKRGKASHSHSHTGSGSSSRPPSNINSAAASPTQPNTSVAFPVTSSSPNSSPATAALVQHTSASPASQYASSSLYPSAPPSSSSGHIQYANRALDTPFPRSPQPLNSHQSSDEYRARSHPPANYPHNAPTQHLYSHQPLYTTTTPPPPSHAATASVAAVSVASNVAYRTAGYAPNSALSAGDASPMKKQRVEALSHSQPAHHSHPSQPHSQPQPAQSHSQYQHQQQMPSLEFDQSTASTAQHAQHDQGARDQYLSSNTPAAQTGSQQRVWPTTSQRAPQWQTAQAEQYNRVAQTSNTTQPHSTADHHSQQQQQQQQQEQDAHYAHHQQQQQQHLHQQQAQHTSSAPHTGYHPSHRGSGSVSPSSSAAHTSSSGSSSSSSASTYRSLPAELRQAYTIYSQSVRAGKPLTAMEVIASLVGSGMQSALAASTVQALTAMLKQQQAQRQQKQQREMQLQQQQHIHLTQQQTQHPRHFSQQTAQPLQTLKVAPSTAQQSAQAGSPNTSSAQHSAASTGPSTASFMSNSAPPAALSMADKHRRYIGQLSSFAQGAGLEPAVLRSYLTQLAAIQQPDDDPHVNASRCQQMYSQLKQLITAAKELKTQQQQQAAQQHDDYQPAGNASYLINRPVDLTSAAVSSAAHISIAPSSSLPRSPLPAAIAVSSNGAPTAAANINMQRAVV